jgi:putative transposase
MRRARSFRGQTKCHGSETFVPHWLSPRRSAGTVGGMAPPRIVDPVGYYHLGTRGNFGEAIFQERGDFAKFLELYERASKRRAWTTLDWVLLHNHLHLFVKLSEGGLSEGMQELVGGYSRWFNLKHGRTGDGHTFKNRFFAKQIVSDSQLLTLCAYLALNPVDARLCSDPADWEWSGYAATVGRAAPRAFHDVGALLAHLAPSPRRARARYVNLVDDALRAAVVESAA